MSIVYPLNLALAFALIQLTIVINLLLNITTDVIVLIIVRKVASIYLIIHVVGMWLIGHLLGCWIPLGKFRVRGMIDGFHLDLSRMSCNVILEVRGRRGLLELSIRNLLLLISRA